MAALEIHAPMALAADLDTPRQLVFDFDPGAPATIVDCCEIAIAAREVLAAVDLVGWCKTSGSKGLQMYVPLNTDGVTHEGAADFALAVGQVLERQMPRRVTTVMAKVERPGKIFVDWSQNAFHKTTIAPYSLRARPEPTVSTPVTWDEIEACAGGDVELRFTADDVLERVEEHGDLFADVLSVVQSIPAVWPLLRDGALPELDRTPVGLREWRSQNRVSGISGIRGQSWWVVAGVGAWVHRSQARPLGCWRSCSRAGSIASAHWGSDDEIHACYNRDSGAVRILDGRTGSYCRSWERSLSWFRSGGGEAGDKGPTGDKGPDRSTKGPTGDQGPDSATRVRIGDQGPTARVHRRPGSRTGDQGPDR